MFLAADYPFLDVLWTMLVFFIWVAWFILLFRVVADAFKRRDIGGGKKTIWLLFVLFVPFIGVFAYLIANSDDMARRTSSRPRRPRRSSRNTPAGLVRRRGRTSESRPVATSRPSSTRATVGLGGRRRSRGSPLDVDTDGETSRATRPSPGRRRSRSRAARPAVRW